MTSKKAWSQRQKRLILRRFTSLSLKRKLKPKRHYGSIVNLDPVNAINVEIQASKGRCTYYRETGYYDNGDDRIHEVLTDSNGYEYVARYRAQK